ncbi:hypothetical protein E5Q_00051 [Mixia osmundae IAM 14324]|uniref:Uncharacterized protein n=1 Tax=Mixia osmundae (strain CBS 9802 / IAM 14324 / JCM 22182 / KY 12970) TaxID=764103 RepID=G7DS50_MIXOS|nr:hypothetical protein E5Q_00051 [Mixia osmundae IAM 14324]
MGAWKDLLNTPSMGDKGSYLPLSSMTLPTSMQDRLGNWQGWQETLKARSVRLLLAVVTVLLLVLGFSSLSATNSRLSADRWVPSWLSGNDTSPYRYLEEANIEPSFVLSNDGMYYPPEMNFMSLNKYKRANAGFVSLVRNSELESFGDSMTQVEKAFNRKFGYPWYLFNDQPFSEDFKAGVRLRTRAPVFFEQIPRDYWSYPAWVDQTRAADERRKMGEAGIIYGDSEPYRHMCRFNSGFFYRMPAIQHLDYYWRVEPGIQIACDLDYDPFLFMERNNITYGFTISIHEYRATIPTLWTTTQDFFREHPDYLAPDNSAHFIVDTASKSILEQDYNNCHFWSNFEIADARFYRSKEYSDYFDYLDKTGNFFYERWGDAPVHSIAAALLLPKQRIHHFNDIAYYHGPWWHCPQRQGPPGKCWCDPKQSFDPDPYACMNEWWRVKPNADNVFQ